jgi:CHASE3 domain sensor protein
LLDHAGAEKALIFFLFLLFFSLMAFLSLSDYWQLQGFSKAEADRIAKQQALEDQAEAEAEDLYEAGLWNAS